MYLSTEETTQTSIDELMDFLSSNEESYPTLKNFVEDYKLSPSAILTPSGLNAITNRLDSSKEFISECLYILDSLSIISIKHHDDPSHLYTSFRDMLVNNRLMVNPTLLLSKNLDDEYLYQGNLSQFIDSNKIIIAVYLASYVYYTTY